MRLISLACAALVFSVSSLVFGGQLPEGARLLGKIVITGNSVSGDPLAQKALDLIARDLETTAKGNLVRIEAYAGGGKSRDAATRNALNLARDVEKYLRLQRSCKADLYLGVVGDAPKAGRTRYVQIVAYPDRYREEFVITNRMIEGKPIKVGK